MNRSLWLKIRVTAGAALIGAVINLFPVSLFFGANFILGGVIAQAPTILFGPVWGALAMGLATLPTLAYWRDPFFPFLMALSAFTIGFWLRHYRSRVVEGALLVGLCLIAPIAIPVYLTMWDLPTAGVIVISAKVIVNFMAAVVACSHLLALTGLEARLSSKRGLPWDMRAHLASGLSLVVFLSIGGASVLFGHTEYQKVLTQAAVNVKFFTAGVHRDLARWITDRQRNLEALTATAIPTGAGPSGLQPSLSLFRSIHPEVVHAEVVAVNGHVPSGLFPPTEEFRFPTLRLTMPMRDAAGALQGHLVTVFDLTAWNPATTESQQGQSLVLDQAGRVVMGPARWPAGSVWQISDLGLPRPEFQNVIPVLPDTNENSLVLWQVGQIVYTMIEPISEWKVIGLLPLAPYQNRLFSAYEIILLAGLGLLIPFTFAIHWVSRWLTRPLEIVAATAQARLLGDRKVKWPAPGRIAEVNVLVSHLRATEDTLAKAYDELANRNQALEEANRNLEQMAASDALTDLRNRRTLDAILDQELKRARRNQRSGALLMIDVDQFKAINDTHGHPAGDAALRAIARTIESCVRESDCVARYGGDELAVILFDSARSDALEVAERIRMAVQDSPIATLGGGFHFTVSLGVALYPDDGDTLSGVTAAADQALYTSKRSGRNRVSIYSLA